MPNTLEPADPWLTIEEIAGYLQCHQATVRRAIAARKLDHGRVGRLIRVRRSAADSFLERNSKPIEIEIGGRR